jgi:trehalose 6-phosphate phosphatase
VALAAISEALSTDPARVGLFFDLDGTLAEIVDDPETVVPISGVTERIARLGEHLGRVAVVSGRPVSFLERFFAPPVELSGLYGLEHRSGPRLLVDAAALEWLPVMSLTADRARVEFGLDAVEDKRYSLTIHYRGADEGRADEVVRWVEQVAIETGLDARVAKMSVELHPPTTRSKGDAVEDMLGGIDVAVYCGDDVGDLPAFRRLAELHDAGVLRDYAVVLVAGDETSPLMYDHATETVDHPSAMLGVLDGFLDALES